MKNHEAFKQLSRLKTKDLLIAKMGCTRRIYLFKAIKLGLVGLLGIFVGALFKVVYAGQLMKFIDYVTIGLVLYCALGYIILDFFEGSSVAQKEVISDLLNLRMNHSSKKSSGKGKKKLD